MKHDIMTHQNMTHQTMTRRWKLAALMTAIFTVLVWTGDASAARGGGSGGGGHAVGGGGGGGGRANFSGGGGGNRASFSNGAGRAFNGNRSYTSRNQYQDRANHDRGGSRNHIRHRGRDIGYYFAAPLYDTVTTYVDDDADWDDCPALKRRALRTDSSYWWKKYRQCRARENDDD